MDYYNNHQQMISYYENLLDKHGDLFLSLDWKSRESQNLRFVLFSDIFSIGQKRKNLKILDVGCGFGDFFAYLDKEGFIPRLKIDYLGTDIAPKIIEMARKKYPRSKFLLKDILDADFIEKFDYVFCSGVFNIRFMEECDHLEFVRSMISKMWDLCDSGLAMNFLSAAILPYIDKELNAGRYYYFKPEDIIAFVRTLTNKFIVRHDYHAGDFTLYLLK